MSICTPLSNNTLAVCHKAYAGFNDTLNDGQVVIVTRTVDH